MRDDDSDGLDLAAQEALLARDRAATLSAQTKEADKLRRIGAIAAFIGSVVFGVAAACLAFNLMDGLTELVAKHAPANQSSIESAMVDSLVPWLTLSRAIVVGLIVAYSAALLRLSERLARPLFLPQEREKAPATAPLAGTIKDLRSVVVELVGAVKDIKK